MKPPPAPDYGTSRNRRPSVSYSEFERAADALLAGGGKPGLDNLRKSIGGSPETLRQMLRRYWADLAALKRSPAQALMRLPSEVADLADELWQRSLALAAQSASQDDNAARVRLEQVKRENELRSHTLAVKERTLSEQEATREKVLIELREQVATLLAVVNRNTETLAALQLSKAAAEATAEEYRQRLARVLARAVERNKKAIVPKPRAKESGRRIPGRRKIRPAPRARPLTVKRAKRRSKKR
jgi:hypothetical protein